MPLALPDLPARTVPRRGESIVAGLIGLVACVSLIAQASHGEGPLVLLLAVPVLAAILLRRRRALLALALAVAANAAVPDDRAIVWPVMLVLYTSAAERSWTTRQLVILAAGVVVASTAAWLAWGHSGLGGDNGLLGYSIGASAESAASVALGLYVGARRRVVDALHERAERLDRERELLADRAVAEERVRIAQELHDVVAHNVSLMVVRAQGLGATSEEQTVKDTTDAIADLGRGAMTEMHRTLRLLRADGAAAELAPQPGLATLEQLLEQTRAAGLQIELSVEGRPRPLSQGIDLSAFRIIQEALTNVLKHAGRAATRITLSYRSDELRLSVIDDGDERDRNSAAPGSGVTEGHGLIGMRERATLFGGTLTAVAGAHGGFSVTATLPYEEPRG
jgi:signal transduction histidine kinase